MDAVSPSFLFFFRNIPAKAPPPAISMETIDSNGRVQTPEPITPESQDQAWVDDVRGL